MVLEIRSLCNDNDNEERWMRIMKYGKNAILRFAYKLFQVKKSKLGNCGLNHTDGQRETIEPKTLLTIEDCDELVRKSDIFSKPKIQNK